jgi:hypothetical protein
MAKKKLPPALAKYKFKKGTKKSKKAGGKGGRKSRPSKGKGKKK